MVVAVGARRASRWLRGVFPHFASLHSGYASATRWRATLIPLIAVPVLLLWRDLCYQFSCNITDELILS